MATSAEINQLTSLYVGYFDRAPDPAGLQSWINAIDAGVDLETIAGNFATSAEAKALYPYLETPGLVTPSAFVGSIYLNLFNRPAEPEGLNYWVDLLNSGAITPEQMILQIIGGAQGSDQTILDNKIEAGRYFAETAASTPGYAYDIADARAAIDGVTADPDSVAAAKAVTDAEVAGGANVGTTFTLTESVDTLTGTADNDLFVALQDTDGDTLTVADAIDGSGGIDTLRVTTTGETDNAIDLSIADISSVENLDLRINDNAFTSIELGAGNDFQSVMVNFRNNTQTDSVSISNASANAALTLANADFGGNSVDIDFDDTAETGSLTLSNIDGTDDLDLDFNGGTADDSYTLNLDGVTNDSDTDFFIEGLENLTVNVTADSSIDDFEIYNDIDGPQTVTFNLDADLSIAESLDLTDDAEEATVVITGAGNLSIAELGDSSGAPDLTVDATAATGNIDLGTVESQVTGLEVALGSGDDRVALASGFDLSLIRSLAGGEGMDILGLDADDVAGIAAVDTSSFETLEITGAAGAAVTVDADDNDFENVILGVDVVEDITIEDLSGDLAINADQTGTVNVTPEGVSDDLAVSVDAGAAITVFALDVSDYSSVDFTSTSEDDDLTLTTLTVDDVSTLSFTGEGDVDIDNSSTDGLEVLDLSGMTGVFDNDDAAFVDDADVTIGNLGGGSYIEQAATGDTNTVSFTGELDNSISFEGFEGGVGGDVLDLSAFGIDEFSDLSFADSGLNVVITADEFDGSITLVGVNEADLDGTSNFAFA